MDGSSHPSFGTLVETFRGQLERTEGGAAPAVYHHGELVVVAQFPASSLGPGLVEPIAIAE